MLKQRVLTAIVLTALILWGIFSASAGAYEILMAILILIGSWEWANLSGIPHRWQWALYTLFILLCMLMSYMHLSLVTICIGALWWFVAVGLLIAYSWGKRKLLSQPSMRAVMGILVLIPFWQSLILLRHMREDVAFIILFLILVAAMDTGGYFFGNWLGKHKLAAAISPGKTIEGLLGAVIMNGVVSLVFVMLKDLHGQQCWGLFIVNLLAGLMAAVGDLLESAVKRVRGVKDSGMLLPGHGGVMDRIDGYTAAAPIFVLGLVILGLLN